MNMHTTTPPRHATRSANDNGPLSSGQVKALKIAIAVMGIMIIAALLAIVGRVIYLSTNKPASVATQAVPAVTADTPAFAPEHAFSLPPGAKVVRMSLEGNRLLVHYDLAGTPHASIYDLANGKRLSGITFQTDDAENR
jgi:hypothetical protein